MSSQKFKSIWPLPGGIRNYILTLRKILEKVSQENLTMDQLVAWLKREYKLSSDTSPRVHLRIVRKYLGLMQEIDGCVNLTSTAEEFLRTGEDRLVLNSLRTRVLGFDEILLMLAEGQRLSLAQIHEGLLERCDADWRTSLQTMYRMKWLMSMGLVNKEDGKYYLTSKGLGVVGSDSPPTPSDQ